jgi:predicted enzyme related to lactoylglutathione lyase
MAKQNNAPTPASGTVERGLARHGHVSYLEIPAIDGEQSAAFYEAVLGWNIRRREGGQRSFDDGSGDLIGRWVTGRAAAREPGLVPYIYVDRIVDVVERVVTHGGEVVAPPHPEGDLWVATFRDPAGNLMGLWQAGSR